SSADSFAASSGRLPLVYCSIESRRCLTALRMMDIASSSDSSCPRLICSFLIAACSMRSVEVRSAVRAFIDSVMSARIWSVSLPIASLLRRILSSAAMPLDLPALLRETGALLHGHFRLTSGLHSPSYVQCARLLEHPRNAKALGEALAARLRPLGAQKIVSPALGGVIIGYTVAEALGVPFVFTERKDGAMTLRRGFRVGDGERVVIVEDVVTTGKSTRETADVVRQQ